MTLADTNRLLLDNNRKLLIDACRNRVTAASAESADLDQITLIAMSGDPRLSTIAKYAAAAGMRVRLVYESVDGS